MSVIVFSLSAEASEYIREYCAKNGADLDGLAGCAVGCLMDLLEDDYDGPWTPAPNGLAKGVDAAALFQQGGDKLFDPTKRLAAQLTEAVLCSIAGTETRARADGRRMADERVGGAA